MPTWTYLTVHSDKPLTPTGEDLVLAKLAQLEPDKTKISSHKKDALLP